MGISTEGPETSMYIIRRAGVHGLLQGYEGGNRGLSRKIYFPALGLWGHMLGAPITSALK